MILKQITPKGSRIYNQADSDNKAFCKFQNGYLVVTKDNSDSTCDFDYYSIDGTRLVRFDRYVSSIDADGKLNHS